jgi:hypothetical protein
MRVGSTSALTDGSSGAATDMVTITGVEATITDKGEWFQISDLARETEVSTALDGYSDIVSYAGAAAIDTEIYAAGTGGFSNFLHCGDTTIAGTTLVAGDNLKAKDLPVIGGFFRARNAMGFDKLSKDFMLAVHPDTEIFLVTDVTTAELSWSEVNKHVPAGFEQLINNHRFVGRLNGVSVLRTTIIGTVTEDVAAHRCLALARYGIGWLGLGQSGPKSPEIKIKAPGPQSTNDPLDTLHTMGWKCRSVAACLDSGNRGLIVYSATA